MDSQTDQAVSSVLPPGERTGNDLADLLAALRAIQDARSRTAETGGTLVRALRAAGLSWREIEAETGVDHRTARRWADGDN